MKLSVLTKRRERIHLNPSWQRGPVWTLPKQALLIDSILRGYSIPMIYLKETPKSSPHDYEVVDGQQRLRAIWNYVDGVFALPDGIEKFGSIDGSSKHFKDLPLRMQNLITDVGLVVAIVKSAREPEISRLFSRMQMGVRLNPPELRNAVQTPLRHAIDGVAREHPFFKDSRIQPARLRCQDYLAHAFSICFHDAAVDLKAPQLMEDYERVTKSRQIQPLMSELDDILDFLHAVNKLSNFRLTQKWIFVDLVFLLFRTNAKLAQIDRAKFAKTYINFDTDRLSNTASPEDLLANSPTKRQSDLYSYIQAFKLSAGSKKNLSERHSILTARFSKDMM
jgi:hypothetical protein